MKFSDKNNQRIRDILIGQRSAVSRKLPIHFSGKSAPELFVGRIGYPYINSGILTPSENDNISNFATAEEWSKNNFSVANVLRLRGQLIYGKSKMNIRPPVTGHQSPATTGQSRLLQVTQELALSSKPVSTEIFLKKKPTMQFTSDAVFRPMTNPAPLKKAILEENPKVSKKVDYLTSDYDVKATTALKELYQSNIKVDHLQKLLSIGLLGTKIRRRMVPTRWSITATDDTISKQHLEKILLDSSKKIKLEDIDLEILKQISENARKSAVDIATELNTTARIITYRIKQMIKSKLIQGFRIAINYKKLGIQFYKGFIYLDTPKKERTEELINYFKEHKNIIHHVKIIGNWDLEPEFEVSSEEEFNKILTDIKDKFSDIVKNIDIITISKEHKFVYF